MTMPFNRPSADRKQAGFSMVELMVALVLGLFLATAILQTFLGAKQTYEYQQEFSRIQENGRFAMEFLSRDIRQADYWGCLKTGVEIKSIINGQGLIDDFGIGLDGFDNLQSASTGYTSFFGGAGNQPDAIVLQGGREEGFSVVPPVMPPNAGMLHVVNSSQISPGEILLVTDCTEGRVFQSMGPATAQTAVPHAGGNSEHPGNITPGVFDYAFKPGSSIFKAASIRYWIREGVSGEPVLVRSYQYEEGASCDWDAVDFWARCGLELVEGVENMQILYGVDTSGNKTPNYFVPADQVSNPAASISMNDVVSVQIHLVTRSLRDNILNADADDLDKFMVNYYGDEKRTNDRRLRKVFVSTIALRNRLN